MAVKRVGTGTMVEATEMPCSETMLMMMMLLLLTMTMTMFPRRRYLFLGTKVGVPKGGFVGGQGKGCAAEGTMTMKMMATRCTLS